MQPEERPQALQQCSCYRRPSRYLRIDTRPAAAPGSRHWPTLSPHLRIDEGTTRAGTSCELRGHQLVCGRMRRGGMTDAHNPSVSAAGSATAAPAHTSTSAYAWDTASRKRAVRASSAQRYGISSAASGVAGSGAGGTNGGSPETIETEQSTCTGELDRKQQCAWEAWHAVL